VARADVRGQKCPNPTAFRVLVKLSAAFVGEMEKLLSIGKITPLALPTMTVLGKVARLNPIRSNENGRNDSTSSITIFGKAQKAAARLPAKRRQLQL
jgi:hypothetical protein